jgi:argininosuccinate synthase
MKVNKVVLAYSGGLDTSVILRWLMEQYGCEVVAFCADLGQGEDLRAIRRKAIKTGASKAVVGDLREEFVKDYVFPMLRATPFTKDPICWVLNRPAADRQGADRCRRQRACATPSPWRHRQGQ